MSTFPKSQQVLGDETKRSEYDSYGSGSRNPFAGGGGAGNPFGGSNYSYSYQTKVRYEGFRGQPKSNSKKRDRRAHARQKATNKQRRAALEAFKRRKLKEWQRDWYKHKHSKKRKNDFWVRRFLDSLPLPDDPIAQMFDVSSP